MSAVEDHSSEHKIQEKAPPWAEGERRIWPVLNVLKFRGQQINDSDVSTGKTVPHMRTLPVTVSRCSASYCQFKLPADPWGISKGDCSPGSLWCFSAQIGVVVISSLRLYFIAFSSFYWSFTLSSPLLLLSKPLLLIYVPHFHLFRSLPAVWWALYF